MTNVLYTNMRFWKKNVEINIKAWCYTFQNTENKDTNFEKSNQMTLRSSAVYVLIT